MENANPLSHDDAPSGTPGPGGPLPEITWPYTPPLSLGEEIVTAELVVRRPAKPRVWTALVVTGLAIFVAIGIGGMAVALGVLAMFGPHEMRHAASPDLIGRFTETRSGLLLSVVPGQVVFLMAALGAAVLSPIRLPERLGLRRGVLPLWTWVAFIVATPLIGVVSSQLLSLVVDDLSEQLKVLEQMMRTHARDFLPGLIVLVAVVPGVVEELMFRGYLQTRLLERWPPLAAVLVSAAFFCVAHLDPVHVLGVIPLGLWLGTVAYRADSIWPAILCHTANNTVAVIGTVYGETETANWLADPVSVGTLIIGGPALLLSLLIFYFAPSVRRR